MIEKKKKITIIKDTATQRDKIQQTDRESFWHVFSLAIHLQNR